MAAKKKPTKAGPTMKRIRVMLWIDVPINYERAEAAADISALLPEGWCAIYGETNDAPKDFLGEDEVNGECPACGGKVPEHGPACLTRAKNTSEPSEGTFPFNRHVLEDMVKRQITNEEFNAIMARLDAERCNRVADVLFAVCGVLEDEEEVASG